jgi:ABC-type transporter Mla MlaB component
VADSPRIVALPARVDADAAGRLYRDWSGRIEQIDVIDFAQVRHIDSAGVALVLALRSLARRTVKLSNLPERFTQLCLAHRVAIGGD